MNLYYITSPVFTGTAEVLYDATGRLIRIDVSNTNMTHVQVHAFKNRVHALEDALAGMFIDTKATIVQGTYEVPFHEFWIAYNKKINKARCVPMWERMTAADKVAALQGITVYDAFLASQPGRKKLDPENYLKQQSWLNEWS